MSNVAYHNTDCNSKGNTFSQSSHNSSNTYSDRLFKTHRGNECPICGDTTGDCRTKDNEERGVLCAHSPTARKFDRHGYYICLNDKAGGHTSTTWVLHNDRAYSDADKARYYAEKNRRNELALKAREEAIKGELSLADRDIYHNRILDQLTLSNSHREAQRARGLTDPQIDKLGYRSVRQWQPIKGDFPQNLPGYNPDKQTLIVTGSGILCPIMQLGKIAAFKVRLDEVSNGQRYTSVSSSRYQSLHLYGESPLAVLDGNNTDLGIFITEGNEIKPNIVNIKYDVPVLGGGRYWHSSPSHAAKYLQVMKAKSNRVNLCLDAGDVLNSQISAKWVDEYKFFESQGFDVYFCWWEQVEKASNDVDELDNLDNIQYIKLEAFDDILKGSKQQIIDDINWQHWLKSRLFKAVVKVSLKDFDFTIPDHGCILAIKSGLGTNKTGWMLRIIKEFNKLGIYANIMGYRNNLLHQTIKRGKDKQKIVIYHLNEDDDAISYDDNLAFCINSGYKAERNFDNNLLVLDESISVLLHLINGGTLKGFEQKRAMNILERAIKKASRVILLDGNNNDLIVDFIASLDPSKKLIKVENTRKIAPHKIIFADGVIQNESGEFDLKPRAKSHLIKMLTDKDCVPFIASDSKKFAHELYEKLLKEGKKGILISADTICEPHVKECLKDPDTWVKANKAQFAIITPSCESGFSSEINNYFTHKFSFFCGVLGTSSQHQIMFRLRDNSIEHFVYCPQRSLVNNHEMPTGYTAESISKILNERVTLSALMGMDIAANESAKTIIEARLEAQKDDKWFNLSCQLWALANYEADNLRKCLMYSVIEAGNEVTELQIEIDESLDDEIKGIKKELLEKEAILLDKCETFDNLDDVKKIEKQENNLHTQRKIKKSKILLERLPGMAEHPAYIENSLGFWHNVVTERGYISGHQNYVKLLNFETTNKRHEVDIFTKTTSEYYYKASLIGLNYLKVSALHDLKFLERIKPGKEYHKQSPELIQIFDEIKASPKLQTALGIERLREYEDGRHYIEMLRKLLSIIGVKLGKAVKKLSSDGVKLPHYQIDDDAFNNPLRLAIIDVSIAKDREWLVSDKAFIDWNFEPMTEVDTEYYGVDPFEGLEPTDLFKPETVETVETVETKPTDITIQHIYCLKCMVDNTLQDVKGFSESLIEQSRDLLGHLTFDTSGWKAYIFEIFELKSYPWLEIFA